MSPPSIKHGILCGRRLLKVTWTLQAVNDGIQLKPFLLQRKNTRHESYTHESDLADVDIRNALKKITFYPNVLSLFPTLHSQNYLHTLCKIRTP